jgi:uncharacterized phage protein gp47/JayE
MKKKIARKKSNEKKRLVEKKIKRTLRNYATKIRGLLLVVKTRSDCCNVKTVIDRQVRITVNNRNKLSRNIDEVFQLIQFHPTLE